MICKKQTSLFLLKKVSSKLLVEKIVTFKMNVLVLISRDEFPHSSVWVKEESLFSNNLQSLFLIALEREYRQWKSGARIVKLIQIQNHTYIINLTNLENNAWIYVQEYDWDQEGVLLETWFLVDYVI